MNADGQLGSAGGGVVKSGPAGSPTGGMRMAKPTLITAALLGGALGEDAHARHDVCSRIGCFTATNGAAL